MSGFVELISAMKCRIFNLFGFAMVFPLLAQLAICVFQELKPQGVPLAHGL